MSVLSPLSLFSHGGSHIIAQVILAFRLVLTYDLLEDRRTIDVIIAKLYPQHFKMVESFENLDNILHD